MVGFAISLFGLRPLPTFYARLNVRERAMTTEWQDERRSEL
jgi:hypothetical protein